MRDRDCATCSRCGTPISSVGSVDLCPLCLAAETRGDQTETSPGRSSAREEPRRKLTLASALAAVGAFLFGGRRIGNRRVQQRADADVLLDLGFERHRQGRPDEIGRAHV